jgi:hypothetical protein
MTLEHIASGLGDRRSRLETCTYVYEKYNGKSIQNFGQWISDMKRRLSQEALWLASVAAENGRTKEARECAEFAYEFYPELRFSKLALRLRTKTILGPKLVSYLRKALNQEQLVTAPPLMTSWLGDDRACGWWPEKDGTPGNETFL